ncbi:MAG TPA: hypothetical protein VI136_03295 [Verrucomicrobiae bacterium]
MSPENIRVWLNIAAVVGIVALLWSLGVMLCREWVKTDLRRRVFEPISIRWRPFASWDFSCAFNVIYADFHGDVHRAHCWTHWHRPSVFWEDDEVIGQDPAKAA